MTPAKFNQILPTPSPLPPLTHRHSASTMSCLGASEATRGGSEATTSSVSSSSSPVSQALQLPRPYFAMVWIAYVLVSVMNATLALVFAGIYYAALIIRGGYMIESVGLFPLEYIPLVIAAYAVLTLVFWKVALQAIVASIRCRRLVFEYPTKSAPSKKPSAWRLCLLRLLPTGITFEMTFVVREIIEIATQSYQAYKCSQLISMQWINNFYVGTLALNCWTSPIIHARTGHNHALQRFLYICSDVVLDFASTLIVPVWIISTIVVAAFEDNLGIASGDMECAFDVPMEDVAFINMIKAVQQVFVVTWLDFFTKVLPFISMANCLNLLKRYVEPHHHQRGAGARRLAMASSKATTSVGVWPASQAGRQIDAADGIASSRRSHCSYGGRLLRFFVSVHAVHTLFGLWGVGIVVLHTEARLVATRSAVENSVGCKSSSQPWFVRKFSCTILEINCYYRAFSGQADDVAAALSHVDSAGVSMLIISHCPALHMPQQIQTLSSLIYLEIFNSTIAQWGADAALINSKLPTMQYLSFFLTNMTELPQGVQSLQFPPRLRDVEIAASNITRLPSDLHTKWKNLVNLVIERTPIATIPTTISSMNPSRLSLFNNRITSIPDDYFTLDAHFWILSVARNPITAWPATVGNLDRLHLVLMDYTQIASLPEWLIAEGERRAKEKSVVITVSAGGSVFCRGRETRSALPGLDIVCREKLDEEIEAYMASFYEPVRRP